MDPVDASWRHKGGAPELQALRVSAPAPA